MLARTRVDVDALNQRARAAALAASEVTGPVTVAGRWQWQAGDVLRARRNDRRLVVGDSHVRNGDRFRVLGPGPQDGVIVEDLTGRGRTVLPDDYLSKHAEYGWASTIDAAQGATADVGIVPRPARHGPRAPLRRDDPRPARQPRLHNPRPDSDDDHHGHTAPRPSPETAVRSPQEQAVQVLEDSAPAQRRAGRRAHRARKRPHPGPALAAHTARQQQRAAERSRRTRRGRGATPALARAAAAPEHARAVSNSTSAGPSASSSAPTATPCTRPWSRPVSSSSSCRAGHAADAAPSPTP
jgi:hypothetical protein